MRVFVTGASGWIGSATVDELLSAGHERARARPLRRVGRGVGGEGGDRAARRPRRPRRASRKGAADADGVVHLANKHDWANPAASNAAERGAVEAIADDARRHRPPLRARVRGGRAGQGPPEHRGGPVAVPRPRRAARGEREPRARVRRPRGARGERPLRADRARRRATTGSSPTSSAWPARRASRRTSATAPTGGRPCTGRTPRGWCGSASSRRPRARACTPSPRRACRPR